ncbi:glycosyltransferase [Spirochaeta cellobiosiphila]|uniref:glycosyltransferase n=1 Tax=Spirochaeta cellobiosiphila TaxID=504483 RepID=UPI00041CBC1A|nr:glycosyltransferase [Spirochaeta cellobiosiphila]
MKKNVIITGSDKKYGDFLIEHWFKSLKETNDLTELDVAVLDYGLSIAQRFYLESHGVILIPCQKDGHVVNIRFRDMAHYLEEHPGYDQVIVSDGGDIIFQDSLEPLIEEQPQEFRAVVEDLKSGFSIFLTDEFFSRQDKDAIKKTLTGKEMINAGFFIGPAHKMEELGKTLYAMIKEKTKFGPDQIVVNYLLYKNGFVPVDRTYNYVVATAQAKLEIRDGRFYANGELIRVVHNTGNWKFLRPIENFGYHSDKVSLKKDLMRILKGLHTTSDSMYDVQDHLKLRLLDLRKDMKDMYRNSQGKVDELFNNFVDEILNIKDKEE